MIWNEEYETMPREALEALQVKRLRSMLERIYATVPFYRRKLDEAGVTPDSIKSLEDLQRLPFTTKDDLRDNYPFGLFTVPLHQVVRIHASSGTTGKPTVVGYTRRDVETWAELMARSLMAAGIGKDDIIQNAYGYGLFTGGLGVHYGAEKIGATVIPISGGQSKRQLMIMRDFQSTAITCTPSYALHLAEVAEEEGMNPKGTKLKVGVLGAEPWSEEMRKEIENRWNINAIDIYGLSEIIGPGVSIECTEGKHGLHIFEDHFIPEIIDPDTGEVLPYGEYGELVITTITKEAFPVLRYRTRDITRLIPEPCRCGRTMVRMDRVRGRTDDMLIIRGVNIFPSQIEEAIISTEGLEPHYMIVVDREENLDIMEVQVEVSEELFHKVGDTVRGLQSISRKLEKDIKEMFGISVRVKMVEPKSLQRFEGKAKRVIDNRKIFNNQK